MAKKAASKKAGKKKAGRNPFKRGGPRKKKAESTAQKNLKLGRLTIPEGRLSATGTARVVAIIAQKRDLDLETVELKKKRDLVRQDFNAAEAQIQEMADAGAPHDAAAEHHFTEKLVGLLRERGKLKKRHKELGVKINEIAGTLKGLFDDMAAIVAKEDPEGTLYEAFGIESPKPEDDGEGLGAIDDDKDGEGDGFQD